MKGKKAMLRELAVCMFDVGVSAVFEDLIQAVMWRNRSMVMGTGQRTQGEFWPHGC